MTDPLVKVEDLSVEFRQGGKSTLAVDRISFDINPGETVALVGESGSGKSLTKRDTRIKRSSTAPRSTPEPPRSPSSTG